MPTPLAAVGNLAVAFRISCNLDTLRCVKKCVGNCSTLGMITHSLSH